MKKVILIVVLTIAHLYSFAQDRLVKKDKTEIKAKVLEITDTDIKYKKFENLNGPTYSIKKKELSVIIYANGQLETFDVEVADKPKVETAAAPVIEEKKSTGNSKTSTFDIANPSTYEYNLIIAKVKVKDKIKTAREGFTTHTVDINSIGNMPAAQTLPAIFSSANIAVTKDILAGVGVSYSGYFDNNKTLGYTSDVSSYAITIRGLYSFNGLLKLPLSKYMLYGGLGLTYASSKIKTTITGSPSKTISTSSTGVGLIIGGRLSLYKSLGAVAELGFANGGTGISVGLSISSRGIILKGLKKMIENK
jgi:hypothetical protein